MFDIKRRVAASITLLVASGAMAGSVMASSSPDHSYEIAEGVYSYTSGNHYNSMFIVTDKGVIAIESVNSKHSKGMLEAIAEVTDQPVKYLLQSHNHWDHSSGGQVFKDAGATIFAHEQAVEWMEANPGRDMIVPDKSWEGSRHNIELGDTTVELHYLGLNHGLGMTVFILPDEKIAYIADLVTPNRVLFSIVPDFNIREWERSLNEILALDFERAIFSHDESAHPLQGGTKQAVQDTLDFIQDIRGAIYAEFQKGTNPMMIPSTVKLPKYADWHMYEQWLPLNVQRILLDEWMGPYPWVPEG